MRDRGDVRKVESRVHALRVQVERQRHDVHVAAAPAVAEQAASTRCAPAIIASSVAATPVPVVAVRQWTGRRARVRQAPVHPFDLVEKTLGVAFSTVVGRLMMMVGRGPHATLRWPSGRS